MRTVVVLEDAVEDIERASDFYESIAAGAGQYRDRTELYLVLDLRRDPSWIRKELGAR